MSVSLRNPDETKDILGMLVLINPRCPFYESDFGGGNSGVTGLDVSASLAGLPQAIQQYAFLLAEDITSVHSRGVSSFYRVKDTLRSIVEKEMIRCRLSPKTASLPQIADGIANGALLQRIRQKGHCHLCSGRGWNIKRSTIIGHEHEPMQCGVCSGSGQAQYSHAEKIELAGLTMSKQAFRITWAKYDFIAISELYGWDNRIRSRLGRLKRTE